MAILKVKIIDPIGMHARPAAIVVSEASKFKSDIKIKAEGREGNLKSIMNIMALGIRTGANVEIEAIGPDEKEALHAIKHIMTTNQLI